MPHLIPEDPLFTTESERVVWSALRETLRPDDTLIAMAKSGFVFFDYADKKVVAMPEGFAGRFPKVNWAE